MSDDALHRRIDFDERVPLDLSGIEHKVKRRGYPKSTLPSKHPALERPIGFVPQTGKTTARCP
jgi:hypothetical protein